MRGEGFGVCREGVGKKEMGGGKRRKRRKRRKKADDICKVEVDTTTKVSLRFPFEGQCMKIDVWHVVRLRSKVSTR